MKNVVLFSGGIDSLAALLWAREKYNHSDVLALYCNAGHRYADKEIKAVKAICDSLNQTCIVDSRLNLSDMEKPKELNSIIPYRNTFFILMASSLLPEDGGNVILQNVVLGETSTIDRRAIFNKKLEEFLPFADHRKIKIIAPHHLWTKGEICKWLKKQCDEDLILKTVGCYSDTSGNCGRCNSCFRSWIALEYAGIDSRNRFEKNPAEWIEGISEYVQNMLCGHYNPNRVNETFAVLRSHKIRVPVQTYVFDLDGIITIKPLVQLEYENGTKPIDMKLLREMYQNAEPNQKTISKMQKIASRGDKITIFTSRHQEDREITVEWLKKNNVPFNCLVMGKPHGHFYVDDRAIDIGELK